MTERVCVNDRHQTAILTAAEHENGREPPDSRPRTAESACAVRARSCAARRREFGHEPGGSTPSAAVHRAAPLGAAEGRRDTRDNGDYAGTPAGRKRAVRAFTLGRRSASVASMDDHTPTPHGKLTVRLPRRLLAAAAHAVIDARVAGEGPRSLEALAREALEDWLRSHGRAAA